jgi:hypothetical protein
VLQGGGVEGESWRVCVGGVLEGGGVEVWRPCAFFFASACSKAIWCAVCVCARGRRQSPSTLTVSLTSA